MTRKPKPQTMKAFRTTDQYDMTQSHARTSSNRYVQVGFAAMISLLCVCGCVTEYEAGQDPLPPEPREVPRQPSSIQADKVQIFPALYLKDTDANRRGDLVQVMVYLWSHDYALPVHDNRTIEFTLYKPGDASVPDAEPLRQWIFDAQAMQKRETQTVAGNGYYFELSLTAQPGQTDQLGLDAADLVARFGTRGEEPLRSGVSTVQLRSNER